MPPSGPLSNLVVLDLTRVLAGPYCTMLLLDLGARIIKVELPGRGDDARGYGPFVAGRSAYFMSLNRGKESVALDLKDDTDREIFESLLGVADVLVENFRAGTLARLGYGWDTLHERYPRLIYAAVSGFGQTGPYATRPAYDMVVQAMGGIMSLTGQPGSPPTRVGTSIGDITAGLFTALGISSALHHRAVTGEAMMIDVSMLDSQVAILENAIARQQATGEAPGPMGSRHPSIAPFQAFRTADGYLVIAAGNDDLFEKLCQTLGDSSLAEDPRYASNELRCYNVDNLADALEVLLEGQGSQYWLEQLTGAGIPCGPINDVDALLADPQLRHRNMLVRMLDPQIGSLTVAGNPIKLSAFPDPSTRPRAPDLDGNRAEILAEIARLRARTTTPKD